MFVLWLPQYENAGAFAVEDNIVIIKHKNMNLGTEYWETKNKVEINKGDVIILTLGNCKILRKKGNGYDYLDRFDYCTGHFEHDWLKTKKDWEEKFTYAVHNYFGLCDYNNSQYFFTEEEAKKEFAQQVSKAKESCHEIYVNNGFEFYFENGETNQKIMIQAILLPTNA